MNLDVLRIIAGSVIVLFVPGYALVKGLFKKRELDLIEEVALSIALSIAVVPLAVFYANQLLGIKITLVNSLLIIVFIVAAGLGAGHYRWDKD